MSFRETFLEQERDEARRSLSFAKTAIRNALTELEDGDEAGAIETLQQIVGDALGVPEARFGKPYLDSLIDRLLMPLPSMPANDVQKLMGEAAEMIHMLASRNAGVAATLGRLETAALRVVETFRRDMAQGYHTKDKQYVVDMLTPYLTPSAGVDSPDGTQR
jgi:hypothetical protein